MSTKDIAKCLIPLEGRILIDLREEYRTVEEIAARLNVEKGAIEKSVENLKLLKLVEEWKAPNRRIFIKLNEAGRMLSEPYSKILSYVVAWFISK